MKKKTPAVRVSKQTQTYPLRGDRILPKQRPSPESSIQQLHEATSETFLHSSSVSSFQPIISEPLALHSRFFSLPLASNSLETTESKLQIDETNSFVKWVPKPHMLSFTAMPQIGVTAVSSTNFFPRRETFLNLSIHGSTSSLPSDFSIKSAMRRHSSMEGIQSYQDSMSFFGPHATTAPITSATEALESRKSFLKPRFSTVEKDGLLQPVDSAQSVSKMSKGRRRSDVSQKSAYSAVSNIRQFSNPFLNSYKGMKLSNVDPRSVSQALSEISHSATLKTRFAEPTQQHDGIGALPWCIRSKCCHSCCRNCSIYDPICGISCCFPYIQIFWLCTLAFGFFSFWVTLFAIWGDVAWPGGEIFEFYTMAITAYIVGWIFACINIPPSLGMFAAGILFGNMGWVQTRSSIAATTRAIVVAFILLRAGLNTDATIFKTRGGLISRMALVPGLSEMFVATMFGAFMLDLPWFWALLFGSVIAALSPLAIIYSLVWLRENGYGENKGITSVLLMMYALDNITLVTLFGIFFTLTFDVQVSDGGAIGFIILQTLASICGGIGAGFTMGTIITFFPHRYDPYCGIWRTVLLSCSGLGTILATHILLVDGAGYLCTIVMAFTASAGWKSLGTPNCVNPVNMVFALAWHVLQPMALGLIGAEVNIAILERHTVKSAFIIVPCCMMQTRFSMSYLMTGMAGFNRKERLFMALLSMTKGTPQAALAPMTIDLADDRSQIHFAKHLLDVCVLEVLITLPLGPLIAAFMGTKLLSRTDPSETGTYFSRHESWSEGEPMVRQRCKSVVSRINTDNEFMLFTETGGDELDNESYV